MKQKKMLDNLSENYLDDIKGNVKSLEKIADDLDNKSAKELQKKLDKRKI